MERPPRLLLGDDHNILLEGIRRLLETDFEVIGTAANGRELVAAASRLNPDVIVLDIGMPLLNGIDAARQILQNSPDAKIVVLTQHSDMAYVREAFRAGASAYLLKQSAAGELLPALQTVLQGGSYVSRTITEFSGLFMEGADPKTILAQSFTRDLTPRQREVLQLVAEGKAAKEIAAILGISIKTVEFHKSSIMDELGIRTTAELTRYAIAHGIIQT
jgi:DNA-binding NarL/FixJ family response regulator